MVFYCELSLLNAVSWRDGGFNVVLRMMDLNEGEIRLLKMKKRKDRIITGQTKFSPTIPNKNSSLFVLFYRYIVEVNEWYY